MTYHQMARSTSAFSRVSAMWVFAILSSLLATLITGAPLSSKGVSESDDEGLKHISEEVRLSTAAENSPSLPLPDLVHRLTNETFDAFVADREHITVVLFYATWKSHSVTILKNLETVAEIFQSRGDTVVKFGAVHGPAYKRFCRQHYVTGFPTLRVVVRGLIKKPYTYTGFDYTVAELEDFISHIAATDKRQAADEARKEEARAAIKPKIFNPTPGAVIEVDPESLFMYRNSTNILMFVLFYAPWCSSCQGPQEMIKGVADYFRADRTVVIAKMDCEKHALYCTETLNLEGYPSFFTYHKPSMAKDGAKYEGGLDVVDITQHLDVQNMFFESEGMDEVRQQFEKIKNIPRDQLPEDLSELGGVFAQFKTKKADPPETIGNRRRKVRRNHIEP